MGGECAGRKERDVLRAERPGRGQGGLRGGTRRRELLAKVWFPLRKKVGLEKGGWEGVGTEV